MHYSLPSLPVKTESNTKNRVLRAFFKKWEKFHNPLVLVFTILVTWVDNGFSLGTACITKSNNICFLKYECKGHCKTGSGNSKTDDKT